MVRSLLKLTFVTPHIPTAMTLIIKVADDKLESVRAVLAQTDGVEAVTEPAPDEVDDWDEDDDEYRSRTTDELIRDMKSAIQEVKDHRAGKIKFQPVSEFLDELDEIARNARS